MAIEGRPSNTITVSPDAILKKAPLPAGIENYPSVAQRVALAYWMQCREKLLKPTQKGICDRVESHGQEAVISVIDWLLNSRHQRAQFLRGETSPFECRVDSATPWRISNFERYLAFANEEK